MPRCPRDAAETLGAECRAEQAAGSLGGNSCADLVDPDHLADGGHLWSCVLLLLPAGIGAHHVGRRFDAIAMLGAIYIAHEGTKQ